MKHNEKSYITGIFWVFEKEVIMFKENSLPDKNGKCDFPVRHAVQWEAVKKQYPVLSDKQYTDVPRGRIFYDVKTQCHLIMLNSKLLEDKACVEKILNTAGIDKGSDVEFIVDVYY